MAPFGVDKTLGAAGVTDHGLLTGLSDNDHPQYRLVSGDADIGVTATGSDQAGAYAITKRVTVITAGAAGTGVRLPASVGAGDFYIVVNATSTNPAAGITNYNNVWPASGDTLRPLAANARNYQVANSICIYVSRGDGTWQVGTIDMKADATSRTVGDLPNFYGAVNMFNGLNVSAGGTFSASVAATFSAALTTSGAVIHSGVISPAALGAGPTADYAPTGLSTCNTIRQDMSAAGVVSGLIAQANGRRIRLFNISGTALNTLTLTHNDGASAAANRFLLPANSSLIIPCNSGVDLAYDGTSSCWRIAGGI